MRDHLKLFPIVAFLAFLVKIMIIPASYPDAIVLSALVAYVIFDQVRLTNTKIASYDQTIKELHQTQAKQEVDLKNLQANINGVKLGVGMRQLQGNKT
jgi:peptidoglycan hydrolase CwlO-like protein